MDSVIARLKKLIKALLSRYLGLHESYMRVNQRNGQYYRENERLRSENTRLSAENDRLKGQNKDYAFLRKVFGNQQIDGLLERAHEQQKSQRSQREKYYESR